MKKVFIYDFNPKKHSQTNLMIKNPPKGYKFILPEDKNKQYLFNLISNSIILKFFYKKIFKILFSTDKLYKKINSPKIPKNMDLILSSHTLNINLPKGLFINSVRYSWCLISNEFFFKRVPSISGVNVCMCHSLHHPGFMKYIRLVALGVVIISVPPLFNKR